MKVRRSEVRSQKLEVRSHGMKNSCASWFNSPLPAPGLLPHTAPKRRVPRLDQGPTKVRPRFVQGPFKVRPRSVQGLPVPEKSGNPPIKREGDTNEEIEK
jgi:hypothetical protein